MPLIPSHDALQVVRKERNHEIHQTASTAIPTVWVGVRRRGHDCRGHRDSFGWASNEVCQRADGDVRGWHDRADDLRSGVRHRQHYREWCE